MRSAKSKGISRHGLSAGFEFLQKNKIPMGFGVG